MWCDVKLLCLYKRRKIITEKKEVMKTNRIKKEVLSIKKFKMCEKIKNFACVTFVSFYDLDYFF